MGQAHEWHPILAAHELEPGHWIMLDPSGTRYAIVRLVQVGGERGYRAVTWAAEPAERRLLGYWTSLRSACAGAHRAYLAAHAPADFAGYPPHL